MIQIDELVLRLPGCSEEQSKTLAREIAGKVSENLPAITDSRRIPELRIHVNAGTRPDALADTIAEQIIKQIKLATL